jgi:hypothetical protein
MFFLLYIIAGEVYIIMIRDARYGIRDTGYGIADIGI